MTRRKVIFYNDLDNTWLISEAFNGDKAELEQHGSADYCDGNWADFMEAMNGVNNLVGFLDVLSMIWRSYHSSFPDEGQLPGPRLAFAHDPEELWDKVKFLDEVWEVRRGRSGASLLQMMDDKPILDEGTFCYKTAKPGTLVTQEVVDDAMDCLPPVRMSARCSQMGEPHSTKIDDKTGQYRQTYATFRKVAGEWPHGIWEYCGNCFAGETEERGKNTPFGG